MRTYDAYKDSGVEWLGGIPVGWEVVRLKYLAEINPARPKELSKSDQEVVFLPMEAVSESGDVDDSARRPVQSVIKGYTYFEKGDVLIAKITPCFENGKAARLSGIATQVGFGSTEFHVVRPESIDGAYLMYVTRSNQFMELGEASMYGAGGQKRVPTEFVQEFQLALPPKELQTTIATYLDQKVAALDALITDKRRLLELYEEEKTALINRAVTRGLDETVELKDSGVEWLGEVPVGWEVVRLKYVCEMQSGKNIVSNQMNDAYMYPVYGGNGIRGKFDQYNYEGTFPLIGRQGAHCGNVHLARGRFWASEHAVVVRAGNEINVYYLAKLLETMNLNQYSVSAAQPGLSVDVILNLSIPLPSRAEQDQIIQDISQKLAHLVSGRQNTQHLITLLTEYRTALISEAVTGKIKIEPNSYA